MMHPYRGLPATSFWSAVSDVPPGHLNALLEPKFRVADASKVMTLGSCFASRFAQHIERTTLRHFVTEAAPAALSADDAARRHYGSFSARYGNVYTVRQALQLLERAFGQFRPVDEAWEWQGAFVDPFRPRIEPDGYPSPDDVVASRQVHLAATRQAFEQTDVLIVTLSLTEAFANRADGAVYPLAPGVHGGIFDGKTHEFQNHSIASILSDLEAFVERVREVNPEIKLIVTLSPQPMVATYEPQHVLVSNTVTKARLRVAIDEIVRDRDWVDYFPAYEMIAGSAANAAFFDHDLRTLLPIGVRYVMRMFDVSYLELSTAHPAHVDAPPPLAGSRVDADCDEEMILEALRRSGLEDGPHE